MPSIPSVPLISASPSLAVSSIGSIPAAASASAAGRDPAVESPAPSPRRSAPTRSAPAARGRRSPRASRTPGPPASGRPQAGTGSASTTTGRAPEQPIASVRARSSIIARTTSRSTGGPIPGGVRADERPLQLSPRLGGDADHRQRPEAGRDPVRRLLRRRPRDDDRGAPLHRRAGLLTQDHRGIVTRDRNDIDSRHPDGAKRDNRTHEPVTLAPSPGRTSTASSGTEASDGRSPRTCPPKPPPMIRAPSAPARFSRATASSTAGVDTS